jgi:cold shock CspA family protein
MTRQTGKLRSWNEERGFGFIAPTGGGRELFVHVSALPRDGSRPTPGETLSFEVGQNDKGQPQALKVQREALAGAPLPPARARPAAVASRAAPKADASGPGRRLRWGLIGLLLVGLVVAGLALRWGEQNSTLQAPDASPSPLTLSEPVAPASTFRCDGRTHCSQMTSCEEARHFLRNCPGVKMDSDGDGEPCEQQWC